MPVDISDRIEPTVLTIQGMLKKIDRLHLAPASRRDLESILVRQVTKELDQLPLASTTWRRNGGRCTPDRDCCRAR